MIKIIVAGEKATAEGPFPLPFLRIISSLAGKKLWTASKSVTFDASGGNIRRLQQCDFELEWEDKTGELAAIEELSNLATQHSAKEIELKGYAPKMPLRKHQLATLSISADRTVFAHLHEMGLGKSAIVITEAGRLHVAKKVTGLFILTKKGVHAQWIEEQVPEHLDPRIKWSGIIWKGKPIDPRLMNAKGLTIFAMNTDAVRTEKGKGAAATFLKLHNGRSMMVVDESQEIKSWKAGRTKGAWELGELATYRRIATGTPLAKNVIDAWAQFKFLDWKILGHRYVTAFRSRYCIMGGFENRQIVGQKNTEEFYQLIAPHSFRLTKAEAVDLPPKVYVSREYEMSEKTEHHYKELKKTFMTSLDSGDVVDVVNAAVALVRLQQIVCGYLPNPEADGAIVNLGDERIEELMDVVDQVTGPVVIWARFNEDVRRIEAALEEKRPGEGVRTYVGATSTKDRRTAVTDFLSGAARFFVSIAAAGGTGLNLQGECRNVIYYSNDFNALNRWQSEDRTHRIGTKGSVTYFDLVARKTVDRLILRNLRMKKSMSDLTLDEIRSALTSM